MFGLGFGEIVLIVIVALIAIGPEKLPTVAKALGRGYAEFKSAMDDLKGTVYKEIDPLRDVKNKYIDDLLATREVEAAKPSPTKEAAQAPGAEDFSAYQTTVEAEAPPIEQEDSDEGDRTPPEVTPSDAKKTDA